MFDLLFEFLVPAFLHAARLLIRLVGEIVIEANVIRLWRRFRSRHLRAEAKQWAQAGDWAAFGARYGEATMVERQVLLEVGAGRPELAVLYAEALHGDWDEVLPAVRVLKRQDVLPPVVVEAARAQHALGGKRAELVRPLKLDVGSTQRAQVATPAP